MMTNRPKAVGTAAETAFVTYLRTHGWPYAERRSLQGGKDKGDTTGHPGLCFEVKVAHAQYNVSAWLHELEVEIENAGAHTGALIVKPRGLGATSVGRWHAWMPAWRHEKLIKYIPNDVIMRRYSGAKLLPSYWLKDVLSKVEGDDSYYAEMMPRGVTDLGDFRRLTHVEEALILLRRNGYGDPLS
jgi:hypothetical protein